MARDPRADLARILIVVDRPTDVFLLVVEAQVDLVQAVRLGATLGDILTKPVVDGGLNLSRFTSSFAIAGFMIACILVFSSGSEEEAARLEK